MPQLSPLPWLFFVVISFFPMLFVVMICELVFNEIGILEETYIEVVNLKW